MLTQVLIAGALLALAVAAVLGHSLSTISAERDAAASLERAHASITAAAELERHVIGLQTGVRGMLVTGDPRFLEPYREALAVYEQLSRDLLALTQDDPSSRRIATQITDGVESYVVEFITPQRELAARDIKAAREVTAGGEGKRRMDALGDQFAELRGLERDRAEAESAEASLLASRAQVVGVAGLIALIAGLAIFLFYLSRRVIRPVRDVSQGAEKLAQGDLSTRIAHGRRVPNELATMSRAFNEMAEALEASEGDLRNHATELVEREAVTSSVLDATPDAIGLFDSAGRVIRENTPMTRLRAAVPQPVWSSVGVFGPKAKVDEIEVAGKVYGRYRSLVRNAAGQDVGWIAVLRDVTAERDAERAKEEFFALVSHEFRTPLTSIVGYLELLLEDGDPDLPPMPAERRREFLDVINRNSVRLLRLVGDLLFVAQADQGGLKLDRCPMDLAAVVRDAVEGMLPKAQAGAVSLELRGADEPATVVGDADRLAQVVDNLLSNAVKFTPEGGEVTVALESGPDEVVLTVADTGIGIPEEEQERFFERFFRASTATAASLPGIGLGLAVTKAIVEGHGGALEVQSRTGRGTRMTMRLPAGVGAALASSGPAADRAT